MYTNNLSINLSELEKEVCRAKQNDNIAKEHIIEIFQPYINKMSNNTFINGMNKEDIKQDLILYLLMSIDKYNGSNQFFWYAIQTMRNNIYAKLKKRKREDNFVNIDKLALATQDISLDKIIYAEEQYKLLEYLKTLNHSEYSFIYKYFYLNYTYDQLMSELNISYYAITARKSRLVKKIRKYMISSDIQRNNL